MGSATRKTRLLPKDLRRGQEMTFSVLDSVLEVPPEEFEGRVAELLEELDRLEIRLVEVDHPSVPPAPLLSSLSDGDAYAADVLKLHRLDREGEYRLARRYALVKERFRRALETAAAGREGSRVEDFNCLVVPGTPGGGPAECLRLKAALGPERGARLRERCREFNQVRNAFLEGCLYIVLLSLASFRFPGVPREDLIQEGNSSLFRAVDRYDWRKGVRFRTYAEYWVHQAFLEAVYNQSRTVRVPAWVQKATRKIRQAQGRIRESEEADRATVAQALGLDPGKVEEILRDNRQTVSLDRETGSGDDDGGGTLLDMVAVEGDALEEAAEREEDRLLPARVRELLSGLPPRERHVLELRFGLNGESVHTLTEVGDALGVSAERVRQIQANAMRRLQEPVRSKKLLDFA